MSHLRPSCPLLVLTLAASLFVLVDYAETQNFSIRTSGVQTPSDDVFEEDFNHDLIPDLLLVNRTAQTFSVYLNRGNGMFSSGLVEPIPDVPVAVDIVDVNLDGHPDVIVGQAAHASFLVYIGTGNGTFLDPRPYSLSGWPVGLSVTGNRGFAVDPVGTDVLGVSNDRISIALGRDYETTFVEGATVFTWTGQGKLTHALFADFTSDGNRDILIAQCCDSGTPPQSNIYLIRSTPELEQQWQPPLKIVTTNQVHSLSLADIRQDGKMGFLAVFSARPRIDHQGVLVFAGSGAGSFKSTRLIVPASSFDVPRSPQMIDYNADGYADIAVVAHHRVPADASAPHDDVLLWTARANGTYAPYTEIKLPSDSLEDTSGAASLRAADINTDGRVDLIVANPRDNTITILTNTTVPSSSCRPRSDGPSVVSCSPVDGAVIDAPDLPVRCTAYSGTTTGCTVFIDGIKLFTAPVYSKRFVETLGKHAIELRATGDEELTTTRRVTLRNRYVANCPPGATDSVNVCVPSQGEKVFSPVRVLATGSSNNMVTGTNIYVDDVLAHQSWNMLTDTQLKLSSGPHRLVVKSWNRNGLSFATTRDIVVSPECPAGAMMTVNVCAPLNGAITKSQTHVEAVANSDESIVGWRIYLGGRSIFASQDYNHLSTDLVLPKGEQSMTIKAWDRKGRVVGTVTRTFSVQ